MEREKSDLLDVHNTMLIYIFKVQNNSLYFPLDMLKLETKSLVLK